MQRAVSQVYLQSTCRFFVYLMATLTLASKAIYPQVQTPFWSFEPNRECYPLVHLFFVRLTDTFDTSTLAPQHVVPHSQDQLPRYVVFLLESRPLAYQLAAQTHVAFSGVFPFAIFFPLVVTTCMYLTRAIYMRLFTISG